MLPASTPAQSDPTDRKSAIHARGPVSRRPARGGRRFPINTWSPCAATIRSSVDLPAPGRPTTDAISPDRTKSDTPARAGDVTPGYRWVIWSRKTYITQVASVETPVYRSRRVDLVIVQSGTERRGEKKRTKASRDFRRNSASERPIWRVRGRPGRPLRRGRSSACASRLTAIRTAALRVGSPAMVSYPSCRKWYRAHQSNTSASVIWLVGVGLNPRYWGTVRRRDERRCPQLCSGTRAPTADWPAWPGPGARHARYGAWCA